MYVLVCLRLVLGLLILDRTILQVVSYVLPTIGLTMTLMGLALIPNRWEIIDTSHGWVISVKEKKASIISNENNNSSLSEPVF